MRVGIYGTGYKATELLYKISCYNKIICGMMDSEEIRRNLICNIVFFAETRICKECYQHKKVISGLDIDPEEIDYLIIATDSYLEIVEFLENNHLCYSRLKNKIIPYTEFRFSDRNVLRTLADLPTQEEYLFGCNDQKNVEVLDDKIVISGEGDEEFYFLMPYGIGDTIYACGYVDEYIKENKIKEKIAIVCKPSQEIIPRWFGFDRIIADADLVEELNKFSISHQVWKKDNYLYCHFPKNPNGELNDETRVYAWESMLNQYRKLVFRFKYEGIFKTPKIDIYCGEKSDKKSVVIFPHASTIDEMPFEFWEEVISGLSKDYDRIYVNSKDERYVSLPKVQSIFYDLRNTISVCKESDGVIAYRSGICDALAFVNTRLLIINPTIYWHEVWDVGIASKRQGICNYLLNKSSNTTATEIVEMFKEIGAGR